MPISRLMTTGLNIDHMVIHFFNPHNGSNYASKLENCTLFSRWTRHSRFSNCDKYFLYPMLSALAWSADSS